MEGELGLMGEKDSDNAIFSESLNNSFSHLFYSAFGERLMATGKGSEQALSVDPTTSIAPATPGITSLLPQGVRSADQERLSARLNAPPTTSSASTNQGFNIGDLLKGGTKLMQDAGRFWDDMIANRGGLRDQVLNDLRTGSTRALEVIGRTMGSAAEAVEEIVNDPEKREALVNKLQEGLMRVVEVASKPETYIDFAQRVGKSVQTIVTDPKEAARAVWEAAKFGLEMIGIVDAVQFVNHALQGVSAYGRGDEKAATGHFIAAGYHGTFALLSVGSIAATVGSGGAGSGSVVATQALKTAAKGLLKEGAEKIGKEIVSELAEKGLKEALEKGAREIADSGAQKLAREVAQKGTQALTKESMESAMREAGEKVTAGIMKQMNVSELVKDKTVKLLEELEGKSVKEITEILDNQNIPNAKARAKELFKALKNGSADEVLQEALVDGISRELNDAVTKGMETEFRKRLRDILEGKVDDESSRILSKAIREQAAKEGKEVSQLVDEYVEAGWKGAREGAEKAVREAVEKGVREAFEEFRRRRRDDDRAGAQGRTSRRQARTGDIVESEAGYRVGADGILDVGGFSIPTGHFAYKDILEQLIAGDREGAMKLAERTKAASRTETSLATNNSVSGPRDSVPNAAESTIASQTSAPTTTTT